MVTKFLLVFIKIKVVNNLNVKNSGRIKIENEDFLMYDVPGDGQCFFHALSLAITGHLSQSLVYRSLQNACSN
jgi:hypothetical protein